MSIQLTTQAVQLFCEIGFLSLSRNNPAAGKTIFDMLRRARPNQEAPAIGQALSALAVNDVSTAATCLRTAEQTSAVLAISVLAYVQLGERETAKTLLEDLEMRDAPGEILQIARGALGLD